MQIKVLSRADVEELQSNSALDTLLGFCKIISISDTEGENSKPPFRDGLLPHPNILELHFDDITGNEMWKEKVAGLRPFSTADARRIADFVGEGSCPLIVHCSAGVSRSGAVGLALDLFFNQEYAVNADDHRRFLTDNPQIHPNELVLDMLTNYMRERLGQRKN